MLSKITGYHQDEEAHWVAELECGHTQHVRHKPPWQNRPWVISQAGREERLGQELDCLFCNLAKIPQGFTRSARSPSYTQHNLPEQLLHPGKSEHFFQLVVEHGKLELHCPQGIFVLRPGVLGVVEANAEFQVKPLGDVQFYQALFAPDDGQAP